MTNSEIAELIPTDASLPGRILTRNGGTYALPIDQQALICYFDDGRLLVEKSQLFSPQFRSLEARLQRAGRRISVIKVDQSQIKAAYDKAGSDSSNISSSDTQKFVMQWLDSAVKARCSDIHIIAGRNIGGSIEFRVHNDLRQEAKLPFGEAERMLSAIYQSMTDVSDPVFNAKISQDARISDRKFLPAGVEGIRVATLPMVDGCAMTLRLLYNDTVGETSLEKLGYHPNQVSDMQLMRMRPTGIVLVGGPTGSGKSTTLQRTLLIVIRDTKGRKRVITVEDPPEYPIPGAIQSPVFNAETEEQRSAAFQSAIRAAMRMDPNIMMIGEVRDEPSAQLAVRAALTGHQLFTTIHVNGVFGIFDRLLDLNVTNDLITDPAIVSGLICQRLLKTLCPNCKIPLNEDIFHNYDLEDIARITGVLDFNSNNIYARCQDGCVECTYTGTSGRTVVAETVLPDRKLMDLVRSGNRASAIKYWLEDLKGMSMRQHAITKIEAGMIDPFEAEEEVGALSESRI